MPAVPQIPKVIHFTLEVGGGGAEDFSLDVIDAAVVPTPGPIQTVRTLDGTKHQDTEAETWGLAIKAVADWDTTRPGLASYLFTNKGATASFVLNVHTDSATGSTTAPPITGTCTLVPIGYGGEGNVFAEYDVVFPIDGDPTLDTTP